MSHNAGVQNNATEKQIITAYKTLLIKFHPDRNPGSTAAAESYKAITEAYKVLL
jgi:molecular chaperone DnaJ